MIEEVADLPDAEIKIPATLIGDELAEVPVVEADRFTDDDALNSDDGNSLAEADDGSDTVSEQPASTDGAPDGADGASGDADSSLGGTDSSSGDADSSLGDADSSSGGTDEAAGTAPSGQYGQLDAENNITYELDGEQRTQILNDLAADIQASIDTILADKYYYPNISDIQVNGDCTEFIIYLTSDTPNIYESMLTMSFYTVGDRYQIYNGVPMDDAKTVVAYVNQATGAELARTDSTSVQSDIP